MYVLLSELSQQLPRLTVQQHSPQTSWEFESGDDRPGPGLVRYGGCGDRAAAPDGEGSGTQGTEAPQAPKEEA